MATLVKKWWTLKNVEWTKALVKCWNFGDVLVVCQRCITKLLQVVAMVMCENLCFIILECCDWRLYLGNQMGKLGTKGFGHHITWVFKKKDVHVCCTMWLNLWDECLVQLGKKDVICLSQTPNDPWCSNREFHEGFEITT